eukprot:gene4138-8226_t
MQIETDKPTVCLREKDWYFRLKKMITGDETGLLKLVNLKQRNYLTYLPSVGEQNRAFGIRSMCWTESGSEFALLRQNGKIEKWNCNNNENSLSYSNELDSGILDASKCSSCKENNSNIIITGDSGSIKVINTKNDLSILSEFSARGPIASCATCINGIAVGGNENDLQLWDLTTQQPAWTAKNLPHDNLSLRIPIWITAIAFPSEQSEVNGCEIYTGTAYKQIRLYDTRHKRQPQLSFEIGEYRVTAILPGVTDRTLYVADTYGGLHLWDVRTQRRIYTLKGCTGSIRDLTMNASRTIVGCVGLERFAHSDDEDQVEDEVEVEDQVEDNEHVNLEQEDDNLGNDDNFINDDDADEINDINTNTKEIKYKILSFAGLLEIVREIFNFAHVAKLLCMCSIVSARREPSSSSRGFPSLQIGVYILW